MLLILFVYALYALVYPLGKIALGYTTPCFLTAFIMIVAGTIVTTFNYFFRPKALFKITFNELISFLYVSFFSIFLAYIIEFSGLKSLTASKTAFVYNLYPFTSALLAYIFLKDKLTKKKWLGIFIALLGLIPLLLFDSDLFDKKTWNLDKFLFSNEMTMILGLFVCPLGWLLIQNKIKYEELDPFLTNGITMLFAGLISLTMSFYFDNWKTVPITDIYNFLPIVLIMIFMTNILSDTFYYKLLKNYSYTLLTFAGSIIPIITAIFDWIIFGVTVSRMFCFASISSLIGFYFFYKEELYNDTGKTK